MISRCRATIEPCTPSVRDGRDNYGLGGRCMLLVPTPSMWGPGRPSPRPGEERPSPGGRDTHFLKP